MNVFVSNLVSLADSLRSHVCVLKMFRALVRSISLQSPDGPTLKIGESW